MQNIMPYKLAFNTSNPTANPATLVLGGNNETGAHWGGCAYRGQMLFVAQSICMPCQNLSIQTILSSREDTG